MINGNKKGKVGEREAAKFLRELLGLPDVRRSQQYCGESGDADLAGLPGLHVEVKRAERAHVRKWMDQAIGDCTDGSTPIVLHRANREPWLITLEAKDLIDLATKIYLIRAESN